MISGIVTIAREVVVPLSVRGSKGQTQEIKAVIDTGFDGSLTLPANVISALGVAVETARFINSG